VLEWLGSQQIAAGCRIPVVRLLWEQDDGVQFSAPRQNMNRLTLTTKPSLGYELIDSGGEEKLERFGDVLLLRPDPQALWPKQMPKEWLKANGVYVKENSEGNKAAGKWTGNIPTNWEIEFEGLTLIVKPTSFKHTGLFPEQSTNWEWSTGILAARTGAKVLNLFAYTGGASLAAAKAGAEVTHVDSSKSAVAWARENAAASGLEDKPIHWIVEDVLVFVEREIKRGNRYDAIIMDPPAFGHGPKNEIWKIEENLVGLIEKCKLLLSEKPLFVLVNGYAEGYSPLAFAHNLTDLKEKYGGEVEYGELTIEEKGGARMLPAGIFARWKV
jgi:23S rRNA (cytosine1962-C5)-methyltransferase